MVQIQTRVEMFHEIAVQSIVLSNEWSDCWLVVLTAILMGLFAAETIEGEQTLISRTHDRHHDWASRWKGSADEQVPLYAKQGRLGIATFLSIIHS